jgi:hypothetical protein
MMLIVMLLWVYIHTVQAWKICLTSLKNMPDKLEKYAWQAWKISLTTVVRHIYQACPVWIYTQSNITSINFVILAGMVLRVLSKFVVQQVSLERGYSFRKDIASQFLRKICILFDIFTSPGKILTSGDVVS